MRKIKKLYLMVLLVSFVLSANSQTYQDGDILVNTTWKIENSPFFIIKTVFVDSNTTLTIEPGSVVIFENYNSKMEIKGKLISNGVTFLTHYNTNYKHGDSLWFNNKYYSPKDYKLANAEYEKSNYETWFMPGLSYTYFQPHATDSIGHFSGVTVEYLIFAKVGQNDNPGPSHVRVYSKLNILNSDKTAINSMFMYTIGLDLSLEKNPKRSFLVPYFGLEFGGISQKQFGSTVQFTPTFGIHILSKKNIYINVHGGYIYPNKNFEMLQGWFGQAGLNFALW